jgi:hypothetical protein
MKLEPHCARCRISSVLHAFDVAIAGNHPNTISPRFAAHEAQSYGWQGPSGVAAAASNHESSDRSDTDPAPSATNRSGIGEPVRIPGADRHTRRARSKLVKPRRSVTEASSQWSREPTPSRPQVIVRQVDHKPRPTTGRLRSDRHGEVLRSDEPQICSVLIASLDPVRVGANAVSSRNPSQARNQCARSAMEARTERQRLFSHLAFALAKQISKSPITRARPLRERTRVGTVLGTVPNARPTSTP